MKGRAYEGFHRRSARRVLLALRHHRASLRYIKGLLHETPKLLIAGRELGYRHTQARQIHDGASLRAAEQNDHDRVDGRQWP